MYKYDPYYLNEVIDYGFHIEAETVLMVNGEIYYYQRKGDGSSKYYPWIFDPNITHRRLEWTIGNNASVDKVALFWRNLGKKAEIINIRTFIKPELPERT